VTINLGIRPN